MKARLVCLVAALTFASGASLTVAVIPDGVIGAQVEPIFCDTRDISLNHRFSPVGHVELDTGAYVFDLTDLGDPTFGTRLFTRTYHSLDTRTTLLGRGWMDNFEVRLRKDSPPEDAVFTGPDGWAHIFEDAWVTNEVVRSRSSSATLAKDDHGGYVVTYKGHKWTFNSVGSLTRTDYPGDEWVEVKYVGPRLAESVGPDGPELAFEVVPTAAGDRLIRVTDTTGIEGSVDFEFDDDGRLIRAAASNGEVRRYAYRGRSERIATIADDNNTVLIAAEYDSRGRVVRLQDADGLRDGQAELFRYEDLSDGGIRTTVTYPESRVEPDWNPVQIVTHDAFHRVTEERLQPTSAETYVGRFYYDNHDNQLSVDGPCPIQTPVLPMDGPMAGPLAIFSIMAIRVLVFIAYLVQLVLDEVLLMITI